MCTIVRHRPIKYFSSQKKSYQIDVDLASLDLNQVNVALFEAIVYSEIVYILFIVLLLKKQLHIPSIKLFNLCHRLYVHISPYTDK